MALTAEQEAVIAALEEEIGRPLTTTEQQTAEAFLVEYDAAAQVSAYGDSFRGTFAEIIDRATHGVLSPGRTFEGGRTPTTFQLAIAVGGFTDAKSIIYEGMRPGTPELYAERLREEAGVGAPSFVSDIPTSVEDAQTQALLDGVEDPELRALLTTIIAEGEDEPELPKFLGGIPQGTLLPQNFAEVSQQWQADLADYNAMNDAELAFTGGAAGAPGPAPKYGEITYGSPIYMPMDQFNSFATKDPGYINAVQQGMIASGDLDPDDYVPGVWTQDAARAMEDLMVEANYTGGSKSWVDIMEAKAAGLSAKNKNRGGGGGGRRANPLAGRHLVLPAYEKPDEDMLFTEVSDYLRQRLGRDPVSWERRILADHLESGYRAQYDAQVEAAKANFEAGNRAILQSVRTGKPVTVTTQPVERVDPRATLQARFEERYAPELELNQDRETSRENMQNVFNVLTSTSRILGGVS